MWRFGYCSLCGVADGPVSARVFSDTVCVAFGALGGRTDVSGRPGHTAISGVARMGRIFCNYGVYCVTRPAPVTHSPQGNPTAGYSNLRPVVVDDQRRVITKAFFLVDGATRGGMA